LRSGRKNSFSFFSISKPATSRGARNQLRNARRAGLTVGQLTERSVQLIMVGGITAWNTGGREILEFALEMTRETKPSAG
jgi:hypothetical protein